MTSKTRPAAPVATRNTRSALNGEPAAAQVADVALRFEPLGARVLVRQDAANAETAGGIILPESARPKPLQGVVLAVGPGRRLENGELQPCELEVGDVVVFPGFAGSEVRVEGIDLLVIEVAAVLGRFRR